MNKYIFKGFCLNDQEDTLLRLERVINNHGTIVAFSKPSDFHLTLMAEITEFQIENLIKNLEKFMSVNDLKLEESAPEKRCNVLLNLSFQN